MKKQICIAILLTLASTYTFADTCPSISDIRSNKITGWRGYDSDEHTPLSPQRMARFLHSAKQFVLAEYSEKNNRHGAIHCYYRDKNGSDVDMYLSKNSFQPENNQMWYHVSDAKQCAAGMSACKFIPQKQHLAQR